MPLRFKTVWHGRCFALGRRGVGKGNVRTFIETAQGAVLPVSPKPRMLILLPKTMDQGSEPLGGCKPCVSVPWRGTSKGRPQQFTHASPVALQSTPPLTKEQTGTRAIPSTPDTLRLSQFSSGGELAGSCSRAIRTRSVYSQHTAGIP